MNVAVNNSVFRAHAPPPPSWTLGCLEQTSQGQRRPFEHLYCLLINRSLTRTAEIEVYKLRTDLCEACRSVG